MRFSRRLAAGAAATWLMQAASAQPAALSAVPSVACVTPQTAAATCTLAPPGVLPAEGAPAAPANGPGDPHHAGDAASPVAAARAPAGDAAVATLKKRTWRQIYLRAP